MTQHFCTMFDHRYLACGLALCDSIERHCNDFKLHVAALTPECADALKLLDQPGLSIVDIAALEADEPRLAAVRSTRGAAGYVFTVKPVLLKWLFDRYADIGVLTYLDSDTFFFADPRLAVGQIDGHSVMLTPHRFSSSMRQREKFGRFNAGWVGFRRDRAGLESLAWWRDRCLDWCEDTAMADGRFADQGYLNRFPEMIGQGVRIIEHPGINLAPWNIAASALTKSGRDGSVMVDGEPLVLFHFHGLERRFGRFYFPKLTSYGTSLDPLVREHVYRPYISTLERIETQLSGLHSVSRPTSGRHRTALSWRQTLRYTMRRDVMVAR
jgi:hypothetical protein